MKPQTFDYILKETLKLSLSSDKNVKRIQTKNETSEADY